MKQKHLSIRISESQKSALEAAAARQETTVGALVRRAVSGLVSGHPAPEPTTRVRTRRGRRFGRDKEIAWLEQHRSELSHLRGQYVVIEGGALVAHGVDLKAVVEEARDKGVRVPFIERISDRSDTPDFWMGL